MPVGTSLALLVGPLWMSGFGWPAVQPTLHLPIKVGAVAGLLTELPPWETAEQSGCWSSGARPRRASSAPAGTREVRPLRSAFSSRCEEIHQELRQLLHDQQPWALPVVVLLNLSLPIAPQWHYAVVVGYDLDAGTLTLRSGTFERLVMPLEEFTRTWALSERWAFVVSRPGQLPVTATEAETVRALVAFERNASASAAAEAYRTGLERWPHNPTLAMGLGNALYAGGDRQGAETVFRQILDSHPLAAAYNNLARLLLERGNTAEARMFAQRGLAVAGPLRETLMETLQAIDTASPPR